MNEQVQTSVASHAGRAFGVYRVSLSLALALGLAACGQKGPLRLPQPPLKAGAAAPASAPSSAPSGALPGGAAHVNPR